MSNSFIYFSASFSLWLCPSPMRFSQKSGDGIEARHKRRRREGGRDALATPLEINSGKFEIIPALNFGEDLFFEITLNLWEKKRLILVKTFFLENTPYIWKYFVLYIRAYSSYLPSNCFALLRLWSKTTIINNINNN